MQIGKYCFSMHFVFTVAAGMLDKVGRGWLLRDELGRLLETATDPTQFPYQANRRHSALP